VFIAFDVLQRGNRDLRARPFAERRQGLEELLDDVEMLMPCRRLQEHGAKAWKEVEARGFEGMVAKDPQSRTYAGTTRSWVKVKVRHESAFLVGGIRNVGAFDGAQVGEMVGDELHYRGIVEWGFRAADVLELLREGPVAAADIALRGPANDARRSVAGAATTRRVSYAEIVAGRLRAPSWRGLVIR
jgi:ATP-dependent DNA ligase